MPVLPAVPSTTVPPGFSVPAFSAASMMPRAARSFTDPPGFMNSALPRISQPVSALSLLRRISGVLPTEPEKPRVVAVVIRSPCRSESARSYRLRCRSPGRLDGAQHLAASHRGHFADDEQSRGLHVMHASELDDGAQRSRDHALIG